MERIKKTYEYLMDINLPCCNTSWFPQLIMHSHPKRRTLMVSNQALTTSHECCVPRALSGNMYEPERAGPAGEQARGCCAQEADVAVHGDVACGGAARRQRVDGPHPGLCDSSHRRRHLLRAPAAPPRRRAEHRSARARPGGASRLAVHRSARASPGGAS